jgi:transposase
MGRISYEEKVEPMSSELFPPIPADTIKSARAIFGRSNFYLAVGDQANCLFSGLHLISPAENIEKEERRLAILHLITIFQFIETLPDLLALDAVRERVDWKYALHLPLRYPFREAASFCEFRKWLMEDRARMINFQTLLARLSEVTERNGAQRLSLAAEQVIGSVCRTSRLAQIWDTMSQCLESLAIKRHDWLRVNSLPHWYDRYGPLSRDLNLRAECLEQEAFAQGVGADGFYLLEKISSGNAPELADLPEVQALGQVWSEQYEFDAGKVRWKKEACSRCSLSSIK